MSEQHQFQMAHHIYTCSFQRRPVEVSHVTTLPVDLLKEDIVTAVKHKYPDLEHVCLAKSVVHNGHNYRIGMIAAHGSLAGLPEFVEFSSKILMTSLLVLLPIFLMCVFQCIGQHGWEYICKAPSCPG